MNKTSFDATLFYRDRAYQITIAATYDTEDHEPGALPHLVLSAVIKGGDAVHAAIERAYLGEDNGPLELDVDLQFGTEYCGATLAGMKTGPRVRMDWRLDMDADMLADALNQHVNAMLEGEPA